MISKSLCFIESESSMNHVNSNILKGMLLKFVNEILFVGPHQFPG